MIFEKNFDFLFYHFLFGLFFVIMPISTVTFKYPTDALFTKMKALDYKIYKIKMCVNTFVIMFSNMAVHYL